jgi:hypothetical protein
MCEAPTQGAKTAARQAAKIAARQPPTVQTIAIDTEESLQRNENSRSIVAFDDNGFMIVIKKKALQFNAKTFVFVAKFNMSMTRTKITRSVRQMFLNLVLPDSAAQVLKIQVRRFAFMHASVVPKMPWNDCMFVVPMFL